MSKKCPAEKLPAVSLQRKTGYERLKAGSEETSFTLLDFWQWSSSDLTNNVIRGKLAEYLVACALGLNGGIRIEWDAYDLRTHDGLRIEVKSAAYIQSWPQNGLSSISFDIRPTKGWDATTAESKLDRARQSDLYVFCLLHHQTKSDIDPLDLNQWSFYVLKTSKLDAKLPTQQKISLSTLLKLNPRQCCFSELRDTIEAERAEA